ncbi:MAG: ABC transporter permease [Deferribacterota bacterium]|nr:ABC transporter permease [Deferribacterota bacterium]
MKLLDLAFKIFSFGLLIYIGIFIERIGIVSFFEKPVNRYYVYTLIIQHINMVLISMLIATIIGLLVGIVFTRGRFKKYAFIALYIVGLGQSIPVLAFLAFSLLLVGIGFKSAIVALIVCSIIPIARNTLAGINSVDPSIVDAAKGMGLSSNRILFEIELPLSAGIIITGVRVALIINISTASLASLIGAGGLGELIFAGIALMDSTRLISGATITALLALTADFLCSYFYEILIPEGVKIGA